MGGINDGVIVCDELILRDHYPVNAKVGTIFLSASKMYIVASTGLHKLVTSAA